jgi:hypothetical protein
MGLTEYIRAGAALSRDNIVATGSVVGSGSVNLGSAYVLLSIQASSPCRVRLYDDLSSLTNVGERNRAFGNTNISESVAMIGDLSMSAAGTYTIDPPMYGITTPAATKLTYWRMEQTGSGGPPFITFNRYLLEDSSISTLSRKTLPTIQSSLAPGGRAVGTIVDSTIPTTYLFVSASLSNAAHIARLRLYSTDTALLNSTEVSRSFATESLQNTLLFDLIISGSSTAQFVPKIVGANLENMGSDLNILRSNLSNIYGYNEIYYILENLAPSGGTVTVAASVHVFSLED